MSIYSNFYEISLIFTATINIQVSFMPITTNVSNTEYFLQFLLKFRHRLNVMGFNFTSIGCNDVSLSEGSELCWFFAADSGD